MLTDISLPWWGWAYLLLVLTMFVIGFFVRDSGFDADRSVASAFSLFSICIFVVGFFNPPLITFLGLFVIPMTAIGVYWEFTRAVRETARAQEELAGAHDLDDEERGFLLNMAIGLNALVVVPGYMMGIILSYHMIAGLLGDFECSISAGRSCF